MKLPEYPQPIEVESNDKSIVVAVTDWGHPDGVQLEAADRQLNGAELAARIMTLYILAKTIALAVRNVEHHKATNNWVPSWPTPTDVEILQNHINAM
jgi:hypothetical protein